MGARASHEQNIILMTSVHIGTRHGREYEIEVIPNSGENFGLLLDPI